jgi:hypothetical protein
MLPRVAIVSALLPTHFLQAALYHPPSIKAQPPPPYFFFVSEPFLLY